MKKLVTALAAATALVAAPATAQMFDDWDVDDDGLLSAAEFDPGIGTQGWFDAWDENGDDVLAGDELDAGLFDLFDADDDGALTKAEWGEGTDAWHGGAAAGFDFASQDADGDGSLTPAEFSEAIAATALHAGFGGGDGEVTPEELGQGLFDWFDADDDAMLGQEEWEPLSGFTD